jgi:hypothetical protein
MSWRKWVVRCLVATVASGVAVAGFAYQHWTSPAVVRQQVIAKLEEFLPGASVQLESASLRLLGGISLTELRLARRDDPYQADVAYVGKGIIYHDKQELLNGKLAIRKIEWEGAKLRVIRDHQGHWNLQGILAEPNLSMPVPSIVLQRATLLLEDHYDSPDTPPLEIREVSLSILNDPHHPPQESTLKFAATGVTDLVGAIEAHGTLDRVSGAGTVSVKLPRFPVAGPLIQFLISHKVKMAEDARQLTGSGHLQVDLHYHPYSDPHWSYDLRGELTQGKFTHARLPYPLENLEAKVRAADGQVTLERLSAQSGQAKVQLTGKVFAFSTDADLDGTLQVEHLSVSKQLFEVLPAKLQALEADYAPQGSFSMTLDFHRRAGQWRERCTIHPDDLTGVCKEFPYRLDHVGGTIDQESDPSRSIDVIKIDLVGYAGVQPVFIQGEVKCKPSEFTLHIGAKNLSLEDRLRDALKPKFQALYESFHPSGRVDVDAYIHRPSGAREISNQILLHFHDATASYEEFPYPLENVAGTVDIQPDRWEFRDFHGTHKGGEFHSHGKSVRTEKGAGMQITVTGNRVLLDEELKAGLRKHPILQHTWEKLSPSGRLRFEAQVQDSHAHDAPDIAVTVWPQGASVRPDFFRYLLTDLRGEVHYHRQEVSLQNLKARHNHTGFSLERGKVQLKPEGGYSVDLQELIANPVVPDAELLDALPEPLRQTCVGLQLKDPLSLRAQRLTIDAPEQPESPPHIYWDGGIRLQDAAIRAGVQLDGVSGVILCRGEHRGVFGNVQGNLQLEKATLFQQPLQNVHSRIEVSEKDPEVLVFPNVKARFFDGNLGGAVRLTFGPTLRYEADLYATQIELEKLGRYNHLGRDSRLSGPSMARLYLTGQGTDLNGLRGKGSFDVENGKIENLPPLLDLLKFLNLRLPDRTAFEEVHARFRVQGPRLDISRLDLLGNAISLGGRGTLRLDNAAIDMQMYAVWARIVQLSPGLLKDLWPTLSKQLLKITMKGRIGEPLRFEKEPVPILVEPLKELLHKMAQRSHDRVAERETWAP